MCRPRPGLRHSTPRPAAAAETGRRLTACRAPPGSLHGPTPTLPLPAAAARRIFHGLPLRLHLLLRRTRRGRVSVTRPAILASAAAEGCCCRCCRRCCYSPARDCWRRSDASNGPGQGTKARRRRGWPPVCLILVNTGNLRAYSTSTVVGIATCM